MKLLYLFIACFIAATLFHTNPSTAQTTPDSLKTAIVKVANLHFDGDMPSIKKRLLNQDGINDVAFTGRNGDVSTFTITYHSSATSVKDIEQAIESTPGCDDESETPYRVKKERPKKKKS